MMNKAKIIVGSDHAAYALKAIVVGKLQELGYDVTDIGTSDGGSVDYPKYAQELAHRVASCEFPKGILLCGTGVGMSIAANKVRGVRAVVCSEPVSAKLSREHNDTNVLCVGARIVGEVMAWEIIEVWLRTEPLGGKHETRVCMIMDIEKDEAKRGA